MHYYPAFHVVKKETHSLLKWQEMSASILKVARRNSVVYVVVKAGSAGVYGLIEGIPSLLPSV